MLDGVDNNETWLQTVVIFPSVDAIAEISVETNNYSADFGNRGRRRQPADQVRHQPVPRQPVRVLQRNDDFDANNWLNNRPAAPRAIKQHQFGATLGGPIIKDKTFFFADYQGLAQDAPA